MGRRPKLTCHHLLRVSLNLDKKSRITSLAIALGVEDKVGAVLANNQNDICAAVYDLLKDWMDSLNSSEEAYVKMWEALTSDRVKLNAVAHYELDDPPEGSGGRNETSDNNRSRWPCDWSEEKIFPFRLINISGWLSRLQMKDVGAELGIDKKQMNKTFIKHLPEDQNSKPSREGLKLWLKNRDDQTKVSFHNNFSEINYDSATPETVKLWLYMQPEDAQLSYLEMFLPENPAKANQEILEGWWNGHEGTEEEKLIDFRAALVRAGLAGLARKFLSYVPTEASANGVNGSFQRINGSMSQ